MPLAYDAPFNDPDRLDVDDHRAQVEAGKACGSGSNYNNMPVLLGDENWAEWDEALQTAAMGEHVHALLTDSYVPPGAQPPIDTPTRTWNHWVRGYQWHKRQNFNLLAGLKRHLSPYMKDKVKDVTDAKTAYDALKSECRQRGANFVGDVISKLMVDVASNHKTIKDFSRAFISKIDQLERMALPWKLPDELFQIWYLHNLGDSFATFRSTIYQHFKVAGIGDGRPLTLRTLMERADNEYQLQLQEQQRTTTVAPAFFTGIKRNPTQAFSERQPDTRNGQPPPRRIQRKKAKPTDYRGPYQKVCSYHGWWSHKNNHDDAGCRYLQSKKAAAYNFDLMNDDEELPDSSMEMDYEDSSQIEDPLQYCTWPESPSALHMSTKIPTDATTLSLEGHTSGAKELEWLMDSGAKYHLCCKRYMYTTYSEFDTPIQMKGVGQGAVALEWRNVPLIIEKDNGATPIELTKVLYVPFMTFNLLSISSFTKHPHHSYLLTKNKGIITRKGAPVLSGTVRDDFAYLDYSVAQTMRHWKIEVNNPAAFVADNTSSIIPLSVFHRRMGHLNLNDCRTLAKNLGISVSNNLEPTALCEACQSGKAVVQKKNLGSQTGFGTRGKATCRPWRTDITAHLSQRTILSSDH
jgi:hypothetical protein